MVAMTSKLYLLCLLLTLSACGGEAPPAGPQAPAPKAPTTSHADIIIIGDSIIARWATLPQGAANAGMRGETTCNMLARFDSVLAMNPRVVVIEGGVNDLTDMPNPTTDCTQAMLVKAQAAGAQVMLLAVLPAKIPHSIPDFNAKLKLLAQAYGVPYIDTFSPFVDEKMVEWPNLYLADGVHLTDTGYAVLGWVVGPFVAAAGKNAGS